MSEEKQDLSAQQAHLQKVEKQLENLGKQLQRSARLTLIGTVLLLVGVGGYMIYGYVQFSELLEPKRMVDAAAGLVDQNIGPARETVEQEIAQSAPGWAEQLSEQAVNALPELREQAEQHILTQSKTALENMETMSADQFRRAITEHREEFAQLVKALKEGDGDVSEEIMAGVQDAMEAEVGSGVRKDSQELLAALSTLNKRLSRLQSGKRLSYDEKLERQALMLVRYIQTEEVDLPEVPQPKTPFIGLVNRISETLEAPAEGAEPSKGSEPNGSDAKAADEDTGGSAEDDSAPDSKDPDKQ